MSASPGVRFISYEEIQRIAVDYAKKQGLDENPPIDIEKHIDNSLKLNVIPFPSLFARLEVNAFTSCDFRKIYVDENLFMNLEPQYRFTLAHELGHRVLHRSFYESFRIDGLDSFRSFIESIPEGEHQILETQANHFAGLILVPKGQLEKYFLSESKEILHFISTKFIGVKKDQYLPTAIELIANKLARIFNVHPSPIRIRMEKDKLIERIP